MYCPICIKNGKQACLAEMKNTNKKAPKDTFKCTRHIFKLGLNPSGVGGDCKLTCISPEEHKGEVFFVPCPEKPK
jgi:hypothetical protein